MEILVVAIVLLVIVGLVFKPTTRVDQEGNVVCPRCGARNQVTRIGILGQRKLLCNGCGKRLAFRR